MRTATPINATVAPRSNGAASTAVRPRPEPAPSVFNSRCPAQRAIELIASKWAILILHRLSGGPVRFNALQRELDGVSQKVLAQQLRRLESHGLVRRRVYPTVPPSVEYSLTAAARGLKPALSLLCEWAEEHMAELPGR